MIPSSLSEGNQYTHDHRTLQRLAKGDWYRLLRLIIKEPNQSIIIPKTSNFKMFFKCLILVFNSYLYYLIIQRKEIFSTIRFIPLEQMSRIIDTKRTIPLNYISHYIRFLFSLYKLIESNRKIMVH